MSDAPTVGGALGEYDFYVERPEDARLLELLRHGEYCRILASRQMGKTSIVLRSLRALAEEGVKSAYVDLSLLGGATEREWYISVLFSIADALDLELPRSGGPADLNRAVTEWWDAHEGLTSNTRLVKFLEAGHFPRGKVVVVLDEIDSTLPLAFSDHLFAAVRALFQRRVTRRSLQDLSILVCGTARISELLKDKRTTPFNVGTEIELTDFDLTRDAAQLARIREQLATAGRPPKTLESVFRWSGGQPFLTMALVGASLDGEEDLDAYCAQPTGSLRVIAPHFRYVSDVVLHRSADVGATLRVYTAVLKGAQVRDRATDDQETLKLAGLIKPVREQLVLRAELYRQHFGMSWVVRVRPRLSARDRAIAAALALTLLIVGLVATTAYFVLASQSAKRNAAEARDALIEQLWRDVAEARTAAEAIEARTQLTAKDEDQATAAWNCFLVRHAFAVADDWERAGCQDGAVVLRAYGEDNVRIVDPKRCQRLSNASATTRSQESLPYIVRTYRLGFPARGAELGACAATTMTEYARSFDKEKPWVSVHKQRAGVVRGLAGDRLYTWVDGDDAPRVEDGVLQVAVSGDTLATVQGGGINVERERLVERYILPTGCSNVRLLAVGARRLALRCEDDSTAYVRELTSPAKWARLVHTCGSRYCNITGLAVGDSVVAVTSNKGLSLWASGTNWREHVVGDDAVSVVSSEADRFVWTDTLARVWETTAMPPAGHGTRQLWTASTVVVAIHPGSDLVGEVASGNPAAPDLWLLPPRHAPAAPARQLSFGRLPVTAIASTGSGFLVGAGDSLRLVTIDPAPLGDGLSERRRKVEALLGLTVTESPEGLLVSGESVR